MNIHIKTHDDNGNIKQKINEDGREDSYTYDDLNVYGNTLIESDENTIITGWNNSVIAQVSEDDITRYHYDDYGNSQDNEQGHGYNQEIKDQSGLIYNRARYYDPNITRFIQIDNNYDGEGNVASQNRYAYCLNNPYKYVDRDGNSPFSMLGGGGGSSKAKVGKISPITNIVNNVTLASAKVVQQISTTATNGVLKTVYKGSKNVPQVKVTSQTPGKPAKNLWNIITPKKAVIKPECDKRDGSWLLSLGRGIKQLTDGVVQSTMSAGEWIWSMVKKTGYYVVQGFKNVMSMLDGILDALALGSAVIAFVEGVMAVALTIGAAVLALKGLITVGTMLMIGAIGSALGKLALYTGTFAMGTSSVQYISGYTGYRLNGEKLTEEEAKNRMRRGETNLLIGYSGLMTGGIANTVGGSLISSTAYYEYAKEATHRPDSNTVVLGKTC